MASSKSKAVLVTGANGYIGNAVARAFVRAGWTTYGLVRNAEFRRSLAADEIISVLGSVGDPEFVKRLQSQKRTFDVIVSTTEQIHDYLPHYNDTIALIRAISQASNNAGVRPLVLFTSGCKDYGMTSLDGADSLSPHTEQSPIKPPPFAIHRATYAPKIFDHNDLFDAVLLRPTTVYGLSSSFYGSLLDMAAKAVEKGVLELSASPKSILHGTHVDDCAEAYVAIAIHLDRSAVKGQCYNISGRRYETLNEIAEALVKEYKIGGGVEYMQADKNTGINVMQMIIGFPQWVSSEKLRKDVGWTDRKQLFSEGLHMYRKAYEAAVAQNHAGVQKIQRRVQMVEAQKPSKAT